MSLFKERSLINLNLTRSTKGFMKTRKYHLFLIRFFLCLMRVIKQMTYFINNRSQDLPSVSFHLPWKLPLKKNQVSRRICRGRPTC